jgi:hypothetical protein
MDKMTNGTNGTNGVNGTNGKDGKDGVDGLPGVNGKDGVSSNIRTEVNRRLQCLYHCWCETSTLLLMGTNGTNGAKRV